MLRIFLIVLIATFSIHGYAEEDEHFFADGSKWTQIGETGSWKGTVAGTILHDKFYSVSADGTMYATNVNTGKWVTVGKADFANTVAMYAIGEDIYTLEKSGTLYRVNPVTGAWVQVGNGGAWKTTGKAAVLNGKFYTVDTAGVLYVTDFATGKWHTIGKPEFAGTQWMGGTNDSLYLMDKGTLYKVNPNTGAWEQWGNKGSWKNTTFAAILDGRLCSIEASGIFYVTNLITGKYHQVGKAEFANTAQLYSGHNKLFTIQKDGTV